MTEKTEKKQKPHLFQPGKSGNPTGRPPGARNQATIAALTLLEGESGALTRKAVEMALSGDIQAMRLCLERIVPPSRERPVVIELPRLVTAADLPAFMARLAELAGGGELTPGEAAALSGLAEAFRKAVELTEIEARLSALEAAQQE